jgi:hypothetical protein
MNETVYSGKQWMFRDQAGCHGKTNFDNYVPFRTNDYRLSIVSLIRIDYR